MNTQRKEELSRRGWEDEEIRHAEEVLERADRHDLFFSRMTFWTAVAVIIFGNFIVSVVLIPFLIALPPLVFYTATVVLGLLVGFVYNFLITDIGHLERKHHILAGILVPFIAIANIVAMVIVSNQVIRNLPAEAVPNSPWIVAGVFVASFVLPYIVDTVIRITTRQTIVA